MPSDIEALFADERGHLLERQMAFASSFARDGGVARVEEFDYFVGQPTLTQYRAVVRDCGAKLSALLRLRGSDHRIYCDFVHAPGFNAWAVRHSPTLSFVGVNLGLYLRLRHLLTMLSEVITPDEGGLAVDMIPLPNSDMATFGYVGRFSADEVTGLVTEGEDPSAEWAKLQAYRAARYTPRSDGHTFAAGMLTALALDYVILHELVHITRGHTGAAAAVGVRRLGERAESPGGTDVGPANELLRGFEIQADWHAALQFGRSVGTMGNAVSAYRGMPPTTTCTCGHSLLPRRSLPSTFPPGG